MAMNYQIIVSSMEETFVAYTAKDMDEATGFAEFCRAEMPGAKVRIERIEPIEWEEER